MQKSNQPDATGNPQSSLLDSSSEPLAQFGASPSDPSALAKRKLYRNISCALLLSLILLCLLWELQLAPLRPGGSWLVLKVLPLLTVLLGLLKQRVRTYQVCSLLVWIYFAEGATRATSDPDNLSRALAGLEVLLSLGLFIAVSLFARTYKKQKTSNHNQPHSSE